MACFTRDPLPLASLWRQASRSRVAALLITYANHRLRVLTVARWRARLSAAHPVALQVRARRVTASSHRCHRRGSGPILLGMLADSSTTLLWTCQLTPVPCGAPGQRNPRLGSFITARTPAQRKSAGSCPATATAATISLRARQGALHLRHRHARIFRLPGRPRRAELFLRTARQRAGQSTEPRF